ncbi:MAG: CBS domain-containing protein [Candidatus Diapherotrites archaeon]|jgi:CBS domain-containing protein|nr:CBS domain-containing protein [Candidatus Diapherotrites archaeon]
MDVEDIYQKNSSFAERVLNTDPVEEAISVMVKNKTTRTVFVVDKRDTFVGVITIKEVFSHIFNEMKPNFLKLSKKKRNVKARDIMISGISVSLDDPIDDALRAAKAGDLQDLPICKNNILIGELDCFELLGALIEEKQLYKK